MVVVITKKEGNDFESKNIELNGLVNAKFDFMDNEIEFKIVLYKNELQVHSSIPLCYYKNGKINMLDAKNDHILDATIRESLVYPVFDKRALFEFAVKGE